jgi:site-specific recombinase XerD
MAADLDIPRPERRRRPRRRARRCAWWLATKRSSRTRRAYLRDLAQWADWLARHGLPLPEADETTAAMWARPLEAADALDRATAAI